MAIAGVVTVNIVARTEDFERGTQRAQQNLRQLSQSSAQGQAAFGALGSSATRASANLASLQSVTATAETRLSGLGRTAATMAAGFLTFEAARRAVESLVNAGVRLQSFEVSFRAITGSAAQATQTLQRLRDFANETGQSFSTLAQGFKSIAAAAQGTALEGEGARKVFEGFVKAGQNLQLSGEEMQGVLVAVSQMLGKGAIQAEEFRGQLSERFPIALQAGARAMRVTTKEFTAMMQAGDLIPSILLPRMVREFERMQEAAGNVDTLVQAINRLKNAWEAIGASGFMKSVINDITSLVTRLREDMERLERVATAIGLNKLFAARPESAAVTALGAEFPLTAGKGGLSTAAGSQAYRDALERERQAMRGMVEAIGANAAGLESANPFIAKSAEAALQGARAELVAAQAQVEQTLGALRAELQKTEEALRQTQAQAPQLEMQQRGIELQRTLNSALEDYEITTKRIQERLAQDPNYREQALKDEAKALQTVIDLMERATVRERAVLPYLPKPGAVSAAPPDIRQRIQAIAPQYGIDPRLAEALISVESGFNPRAVSPAGASGLMQLMPGTAADMGVKDVFDIDQNLHGGLKYLSQLMVLFQSDTSKALAAYNAGPGRVIRGGPLPLETQKYVPEVLRRYEALKEAPIALPGAPPGANPEQVLAFLREQQRLNQLQNTTLENQSTRIRHILDLYSEIDKLKMAPEEYEASQFERLQAQAELMSLWRKRILEEPKLAAQELSQELADTQEKLGRTFADVTMRDMRRGIESQMGALTAELIQRRDALLHELPQANLALQQPDLAQQLGLRPEDFAANAGRYTLTPRMVTASRGIRQLSDLQAAAESAQQAREQAMAAFAGAPLDLGLQGPLQAGEERFRDLSVRAEEAAEALARYKNAARNLIDTEALKAGQDFLEQLRDEHDALTMTTAEFQAHRLAKLGIGEADIAMAESMRQTNMVLQATHQLSGTLIDTFIDMAATGKVSFESLASAFLRMALNMVAKSADLENTLSKVFQLGLQAVGLLGGTGVSDASAAGTSGEGALFSSTPSTRAGGGPVFGNRMYLVGERGPELFKPQTTGYIIPNHQLHYGGARAQGGYVMSDRFYQVGEQGREGYVPDAPNGRRGSWSRMTGQPISVTMHVHGVQDARSFQYSQSQIEQRMLKTIERAQRNG